MTRLGAVWGRVFARGESSLTGRALLSTAAGVIDYVARVLVTFLLNPILVAGLGPYGFGLWQVMRQMIGYATPATGRPAQALRFTVANLQASEDFPEKRRQVGAAVAVSLGFLPLLVAVGAGMAVLAPGWLEAPPELVTTTRWVAALLVAHLAFTNFAEIPQQVLAGENLAYRRVVVATSLTIVGGVLTALAVEAGLGLIGVAAAQVVVAVLMGLLFIRVARRYVPWFGVDRAPRELVRSFLQISGWFIASRLIAQVNRASDLVVLGMAVSVESVTSYSLSRYLPDALVTMIGLGVFSSIPGLGAIYGRKEFARAAALRGEIMLTTWIAATVAAPVILLWNQDFVSLWIEPGHYVGDLETLLILVMSIQLAFIRNDSNFIDLSLDLKKKVLLGGVSVALSLALSIGLALAGGGIVGLCLGFIVGRTILSVAHPYLVGQFLGLGLVSQLRAALRPLAVTGTLLIAAIWAAPMARAESWLLLVAGGLASTAVVVGLAMGLGLRSDQRRMLIDRFRRLASR